MSSFPVPNRFFKVADLSMDVSLAPFYLRDPYEGVTIKLEQCLMQYSPKLGGVLLAWWDLRFKDATAGILWELPEIHTSVGTFHVKGFSTQLEDLKVLLFAPKLHQKIAGTINSVGDDYVSLTVLNTFKAQISGNEMPANWAINHRVGKFSSFP